MAGSKRIIDAEVSAVSEVWETATRAAESQIADLEDRLVVAQEEGAAIGQLRLLAYQEAHHELQKVMILHRIKNAKEYRKAGMTWDEFCRAAGLERRTADRLLADVGPIVTSFSDNVSTFFGCSLSKIRLLGRAISDNVANLDEGCIVYEDERIPVTAEHQEELQALIERVAETFKAKVKAAETDKNRLESSLKVVERELEELREQPSANPGRQEGNELPPFEKEFLDQMEILRLRFIALTIEIEPEKMSSLQGHDERASKRMIAAYISLLDGMRKELNSYHSTAIDLYGDPGMCADEVFGAIPVIPDDELGSYAER